jgi:threonine aldolase
MAIWFKSDNTAAVAPEVLQAIASVNTPFAAAYGDDEWTRSLQAAFSATFGCDVRVFVVSTGTAANTLALASLAPPWGAVFAHEQAHILRDESTAPEFMTGGARLVPLPGEGAMIAASTLRDALAFFADDVHSPRAAALSITQCTELGRVYGPAALRALTDVARQRGLRVHMDGARFANAVAALGVHPGDLSWRAGVDVLSFGATKNGAMGVEAVVFFDAGLAEQFEWRRKRAGHLLSKMRFAAAQLEALLQDDLWLKLAARANRLAARVAREAGPWLMHPVEANELFLRLGEARRRQLREHPAGFHFYDWGPAGQGEARFVVSWNQDDADCDRLAEALTALPR